MSHDIADLEAVAKAMNAERVRIAARPRPSTERHLVRHRTGRTLRRLADAVDPDRPD